MARWPLLVTVCLLVAGQASAATPTIAPAWQYQFPAGGVEASSATLDPTGRYLAVSTNRSTTWPLDAPSERTVEGENAVYYFDLAAHRLLWRERLPDTVAAYPHFVSDSGEFVVVSFGSGYPGHTSSRGYLDRDGRQFIVARELGLREPGLRIYNRAGRLLADRAPLDCYGGSPAGARRAALRPVQEGETAVTPELRRRLLADGVTATEARRGQGRFGFLEEECRDHLAAFTPSGERRWRWSLPEDESPFSGPFQRRSSESPDGRYDLLLLTPNERGVPVQGRLRMYLFSYETGLLWGRDYPASLVGMGSVGAALVARGAQTILLQHPRSVMPPVTLVDALDGADGRRPRRSSVG